MGKHITHMCTLRDSSTMNDSEGNFKFRDKFCVSSSGSTSSFLRATLRLGPVFLDACMYSMSAAICGMLNCVCGDIIRPLTRGS